ncbi:AAA domain-containing protein [Methylobacterium fujisawaense]
MTVRDDLLAFLRQPGTFSASLPPASGRTWLRGLSHFALPEIVAHADRALRPAQERAWREMADHRASLVLGPPGTGKTHLLGWLIAGHLWARREAGLPARILVTAFTRNAIGHLLETVHRRTQTYLSEPPRVLFLGNAPPSGLAAGIEHIGRLTGRGVDDAVAALQGDTVVVGASIWSLNRLLSQARVDGADGWTAPLFDLVAIDEASQMVLGHGLMALAGLAEDGRVVVAGDHRQLPPVRTPHEAVLDGRAVGGSLYHFLQSVGAAEFALDETFRLNGPLAAFPERHFYPRAYRSADPVRNSRLALSEGWSDGLEGWERIALDPAYPIVSLVYNGPSAATANPFEALLAARLAVRLRTRVVSPGDGGAVDDDAFWQDHLAIVSPHRAQNAEIRSALSDRAGHNPVVETVDRIQGKERDAIIASYCVADSEFALAEASFIFGRERLNVTTTRARTKLILLVSRRLLDAVPSDEDDLASAELLREYVYSGAEVGTVTLPGPDGERVRVAVRVQGFDDLAALPAIEPSPALTSIAVEPEPAFTADHQNLLDAIRASAAANLQYGTATVSDVERRLARRGLPFDTWRDLFRLGLIGLRQARSPRGPFWVAEPRDPPRVPYAADPATVASRLEEVVIGARRNRRAPFYSNVRHRFVWMDREGNDVLLPILEDLAREPGSVVLERTARGDLTVDLPRNSGSSVAEPPSPPPSQALTDDDFRVLNALEDIEARRINFGVVEAWTAVPEIMRHLRDRRAQRGVYAALDRLREHGHVLLCEDERVRSRMAELARELRYVKQRFAKGDATRRPYLVRGSKVEIRDRRKPERRTPLSEPIGELRGSLSDRPEAVQALGLLEGSLQRLWQAADPGIAGFQARALVSLSRAWHGEVEPPARPDAFVVTAETGSGKTEAACLPLIAGALADALGGIRGTRAILVYPRVRLAANQAQRLVRYAAALAAGSDGPLVTLGLQNAQVPRDEAALEHIASRGGDSGWRRASTTGSYEFPLFPCPEPSCSSTLQMQLGRGRSNADRLACEACGWHYDGWIGTKRGLRNTPPSLFLPTTESLHQWLHDPSAGALFGDGAGGASHPPRALLADEIHLYTHGHGAQVGYAFRRLLARLQTNHPERRPPLAIGMSATLGDPADAWGRLIDRPAVATLAPQPGESDENPRGREYFYFAQPEVESRGRDVAGASTTIQSLMCLAHGMRRRTGAEGGYRGIVFLDSIDKLRRLHGDYLDAEEGGRLASYRTRMYDDDPLTGEPRNQCCGEPLGCDAFREGECWHFAATDGRQVGAQGRRRPGQPLAVAETPVYSGTGGRVETLIKGADLVFATSSLEVGYDDPDMALVYQHYAPRNLASFVQRKGRGGRGVNDRPITGVTLSLYSPRDSWYFRRPSTMLEAGGFGVPLNPSNFFVRRGQAVAALLDGFARFEGVRGRPALNADLRPDPAALSFAQDLVDVAFGPDLCASLGIADLPALWSDALLELDRGDRPRSLAGLREALPWVATVLFNASDALAAGVRVPEDAATGTPLRPEPLSLALATAAPGNITRRYDGRYLHWIVPIQGEAPWLTPESYREAAYFPTEGFDPATLIDALPDGARTEIGTEIHPRICRPRVVEFATAGRMWGADWEPAWGVTGSGPTSSVQHGGPGQVVPLSTPIGGGASPVHHQSRGALRGFLVVRADPALGQTLPRATLPACATRAEQFVGRGVSARRTGLAVTHLYWGGDAQVRLEDPQAEDVYLTQRFTRPGTTETLLHGYRVETEGVRLHLDRERLDAFVGQEADRLRDTPEGRWHRAQLLRHQVASRAQSARANTYEARRAADLIVTAAAHPDLRTRLNALLHFWDGGELSRLLMDTWRTHLLAHPQLSERRVTRLGEVAGGQEFQGVLQAALQDARSDAMFAGYLRGVVVHGLALRLKQSFVLLGHGDEREVLIHARLPLQFGDRADDIITVAEAGAYGDGTTRSFLARWSEAAAHWHDGFFTTCPNAAEDAIMERLLAASVSERARWRMYDPRNLEQVRTLAAELGAPISEGSAPSVSLALILRILFGAESVGAERFELIDLALEIRASEAALVERLGRPAGTWEAVSATVADAEMGTRPILQRLLRAYGEVEDADQTESLAPSARLAEQVYRLGIRLCPDGCQACLHQGSNLMSDDLVETSTSRSLLSRFLCS